MGKHCRFFPARRFLLGGGTHLSGVAPPWRRDPSEGDHRPIPKRSPGFRPPTSRPLSPTTTFSTTSLPEIEVVEEAPDDARNLKPSPRIRPLWRRTTTLSILSKSSRLLGLKRVEPAGLLEDRRYRRGKSIEVLTSGSEVIECRGRGRESPSGAHKLEAAEVIEDVVDVVRKVRPAHTSWKRPRSSKTLSTLSKKVRPAL